MNDDLLQKFAAGDPLALSRLMSAVERGGDEAERVLDALYPRMGRAFRVAVTGATGGGKSTVIDGLTGVYRARTLTVGVVAEDPTSPFSGGALLGDRIRMARASGDAGVFVRSIASRGAETGFSALAGELADVMDAFGYDVVLMETTGVGQLETRVAAVADTVVVVVTPEGGDEVQSLKSGLMEIGDVFAVNKADRPDAASFAEDVRATLALRHHEAPWTPPVVTLSARSGDGVDALAAAIEDHRAHLAGEGRLEARRRLGLRLRVQAIASDRIAAMLWQNGCMRGRFDAILEDVAAGRLSPYAAARRLVNAVRIDDGS